MNKKQMEIFLKKVVNCATDVKVYNDLAPSNAEYPYIVIESSKLNTDQFPRINGELIVNIWDQQGSYETVSAYADEIQNYLNCNSFHDNNVIGTFYMNVRNNVLDEDKTLKKCIIQFDIEIYFLKEE